MSLLRPRPTRRSRLALAGVMLGAGTLHFLTPKPFMDIVPPVLGSARFWTYASGVVELACGALLLDPRTKQAGATLTAITIVAVYPANIYAALDAGAPTNALAIAAWVRLPFQLPLFTWALSHRGEEEERAPEEVATT